jgi:ABC-type transporter Mla subunit MlaD
MSSNTSKVTRAAALARVQALIMGLQLHLASANLTLGNTAFTTPALVQVLKGLADALAALITARANAKDALANLSAKSATVNPLIGELTKLLGAMFAGATQTLADFGIAPPKVRKPLSAEQAAARAAKAKATRIARGTKGAKAKAAIKGNVTGVEIVPVTAPVAAAPAQTASNASNAPTGASK